MITGRWELKISDYDLGAVRDSQYDPAILAAIEQQQEIARVIPSKQKLLWLAPESCYKLLPNVWCTRPSKRADIYRYVEIWLQSIAT